MQNLILRLYAISCAYTRIVILSWKEKFWVTFLVRSYISLYGTTAGTDDDLPPSHQYRIPRGGQVAGIERSAVGSISFPRKYTDMEAQIHHLEQEAYCAVLRAFKAQSDAITWVFIYLFFCLSLCLLS